MDDRLRSHPLSQGDLSRLRAIRRDSQLGDSHPCLRSGTSGQPVCNYVEAFAGATSIGLHNTAGTDRICSPSNTADVTDSISLPEVDTVAEANSLSAKIYERRTGTATTTRTDQIKLTITYTK